MDNKIKVLVLENDELKEKEIDNDLKSLQNEVGGYIEIPYLSKRLADNGIDLIINEEGKIQGLEKQLYVIDDNGNILDIICGNCLFVSRNEDGDTIGLSQEQIDFLKNELGLYLVAQYGMLRFIRYK